MRELEERLRALDVAWPDTPDLAGPVLAAIADAPPRRRWSARRVAAAVALVLVAATAAVEPARSAVLELLGLDGATIERREPDAPPAGAQLDLGVPVTLAQAARRADFAAAPPTALGRPDAVYFAQRPAGGMVSYVYGDDLFVTTFVAAVEPVIEKSAGAGTSVERIDLPAARGFWLSGDPHGFAFVDRTGNVDFQDQRLAGNTLLLERDDGLLIRVEGRVSRERALAIATSIPQG